jgi:adhesin transport system membrane fusion protein
MTGQVDIKTGNRSVMTYLLKPIIKTFDKSFGER